MIILKNLQEKQDIKKSYALYKKAFPKEEQKPFKFLFDGVKKGYYDLFVVSDDENSFYGIAFVVKNNKVVLLDYLAIDESFRNQGLGSKVLKLLQEKYANQKLVIEIEDTTTPAKNIIERIRRKEFYLRNNMIMQDFKVMLFNCPMHILTYGGNITFEEYFSIFEMLYNKKATKKVYKLK